MNERGRNIIVGLTTLVAILGLMAMLLLFGYVPRFLQGGYAVTIELTDANSLNIGSRVELSGIDIGSVELIEFKQPQGTGVTVLTRINEDVLVPSNAVPVVEKPLLGGSPKIKFVVKDTDAPKGFLATDGSEVVSGSIGSLAGAFGELERMAGNVDSLTAEWKSVGAKLNTLLESQDLEAVEAGQVRGNLTTMVARMDRRLTEFKTVLNGIDEVVNDPQVRQDLQATVSNTRKASEELSASLTGLQQRYIGLADEVSVAIEQVNTLLTVANKREGTVGKLFNDPALYDNLDDAAVRIGQVADELKLIIEKFKAEGVPINF